MLLFSEKLDSVRPNRYWREHKRRIVMVSLIHKLLTKQKDRLFFAGVIVIAASAGGVWSPVGDVTTTMPWIGATLWAMRTTPDAPPAAALPVTEPSMLPMNTTAM
jgi:hypothetical protein